MMRNVSNSELFNPIYCICVNNKMGLKEPQNVSQLCFIAKTLGLSVLACI